MTSFGTVPVLPETVLLVFRMGADEVERFAGVDADIRGLLGVCKLAERTGASLEASELRLFESAEVDTYAGLALLPGRCGVLLKLDKPRAEDPTVGVLLRPVLLFAGLFNRVSSAVLFKVLFSLSSPEFCANFLVPSFDN